MGRDGTGEQTCQSKTTVNLFKTAESLRGFDLFENEHGKKDESSDFRAAQTAGPQLSSSSVYTPVELFKLFLRWDIGRLDCHKTMKLTFQFIQQILLSLGHTDLKPKLQTLKN